MQKRTERNIKKTLLSITTIVYYTIVLYYYKDTLWIKNKR